MSRPAEEQRMRKGVRIFLKLFCLDWCAGWEMLPEKWKRSTFPIAQQSMWSFFLWSGGPNSLWMEVGCSWAHHHCKKRLSPHWKTLVALCRLCSASNGVQMCCWQYSTATHLYFLIHRLLSYDLWLVQKEVMFVRRVSQLCWMYVHSCPTDTVDSITPDKVRGLRDMLNSSAMDIMYYTSPLYRDEVRRSLRVNPNPTHLAWSSGCCATSQLLLLLLHSVCVMLPVCEH